MNNGVSAWNYTYDPLNRLTMVQRDGDLSAAYTYDAGGRRVRSWDTVDGTTDYVYCGLNIIDEINSDVHERHVYAGSMHIASDRSGVVEYYHVDHLGSTRLKTDVNGSAIYESNYEPFGVSSGEVGSEDFRYTGKHEDTTGLYYFGARYYDPATGRFTTRDTVFGKLTDPQSQNRYVYCRNNPHKYVDPNGRWATKWGTGLDLGFSSGASGMYGSTEIGVIIAFDDEGYCEIGTYTEYSGGFYVGAQVDVKVSVSISDATRVEDFAGNSVVIMAQYGPLSFDTEIKGLENSETATASGEVGVEISILGGSVGGGIGYTHTVTQTRMRFKLPDLSFQRDFWIHEEIVYYDDGKYK